ncbi:MAG: hypothetical protein HYX72_10165 [Acidobacteria bacterium]|nr:hypothetical protein [Acidobacteriota bacterium]
MESGSVLAVLVGVIAAVMILQSIAILIFVVSFRKSMDRIETSVTQAVRDAQPVLQSARELITEGREQVNAISAKVNSISTDVLEISSVVKGQVHRVDGLLTEASERARMQLVRVDELISDTVMGVQDTGQMVRRAVLAPVREITAILSGVRTAVDVLFRRDKRGLDHAPQDEELFI